LETAVPWQNLFDSKSPFTTGSFVLTPHRQMKALPAVVFLLSAVSQLPAASILYDSFNYSPVGAQVSSAGAPSWTLRNAGQEDPKIASGSLSYPGLQTASGDNSVIFNGVAPAAGVSGRLLDQIYNVNNATTLYYSLTLQVSNITIGDWGGSGNFLSGSFMMGFSQDTTGAPAAGSAAAPLLIRTGDPTNASGVANDFQGFQLGTGVTAVAGTRVFDGTHVYLPTKHFFSSFPIPSDLMRWTTWRSFGSIQSLAASKVITSPWSLPLVSQTWPTTRFKPSSCGITASNPPAR
jgi:hypothetical protein